jgi:branched-chain amino acid transport system substrate-binding protein
VARLHAILLTPLTGSLSLLGTTCATALTLWARRETQLPLPWTGIDLDILDSESDPNAAIRAVFAKQPDVLFGPYGSGPMLRVARACDRVIWNHGGASSRLAKPAFPQVINVLSPASTYFGDVLQAILASDPTVTTVSLVHSTTGFGKDVAAGATTAASRLQLTLHAVAFEPSQAASCISLVPDADILLVVGNFADELAIASPLLTRPWRLAAFVGAGVEEVLAPLGQQREGLLGPAQWVSSARIVPDEGPDTEWFLTRYRQETGGDPPYAAAQAFAAGLLYARCLREAQDPRDAAILAAAQQLACTTLFGRFQLDPVSGLQIGHKIAIIQWQQGQRRVVWPPEQAERPVLFPLGREQGRLP